MNQRPNIFLNKIAVFFICTFLLTNLLVGQTDSLKLEYAKHMRYAFQLENYKDKYLYLKSEKMFKEVLSNDSMNLDANYGLGALYYNYSLHLNNEYEEISKEKEDTLTLKSLKIEIENLYDQALPFLNRYKELQLKYGIKVTAYNDTSTIAIAKHFHYAYEIDNHKDKHLFNSAVEKYGICLARDSANLHALYGLGTLYYNEAVFYSAQLTNPSNNIGDIEISEIQKEIKHYFILATPLMNRYKELIAKAKK